MTSSERERRTRKLALAGAAALVLVPLLWFLSAKALERWAPASRPGRGDVFDKRPQAGSQTAAPPSPVPAPVPASSPAPVPPAQAPASGRSAAPPAPAPAPMTAPFTPPEPGTVLKVVETRRLDREEAATPSRLPKLKPMKGWTPTEVRGLQEKAATRDQKGTEPVYYLTPGKTVRNMEKPPETQPQAPVEAQAPAAAKSQPAQAASVPAASTQAAAPKPKPVLQPVPAHAEEAPKPHPPVLTTTVGPGGPVGTMDHVPPAPGQDIPPLAPSQQPSEPARPDGTCGRAGWWKNSWTQTCHPSIEGCRAADSSGACTQQR